MTVDMVTVHQILYVVTALLHGYNVTFVKNGDNTDVSVDWNDLIISATSVMIHVLFCFNRFHFIIGKKFLWNHQ